MKYFFASDVHLGLNIKNRSAEEREALFLNWLDMVEIELCKNNAPDRGALFLLGDIFDFFMEYKSVISKKHIRVISKIDRMVSKGIKISIFKGNHDTWHYDYFESIGVDIYGSPTLFDLNGIKVMMSHGHNIMVDKAPFGYRFMYSIFNSKFLLKVYRFCVHPDLSNWFGSLWSSSSRQSKNITHIFEKEDEPVVKFSRQELEKCSDIAYFIFGHLHSPIIYNLNNSSKLVVLGEWVDNPTYGVLDTSKFELLEFH